MARAGWEGPDDDGVKSSVWGEEVSNRASVSLAETEAWRAAGARLASCDLAGRSALEEAGLPLSRLRYLAASPAAARLIARAIRA